MQRKVSRRDFVKTGAAGAAAMAHVPLAYAGGQEATIQVGVIGCGGRGTGAAENCLKSSQNVRIVAMGDMFGDRLAGSRKQLAKFEKDGFKVSDDKCFTGLDAYKQVIDSGVDMVILATPPGFRPIHFEAAIDAGKHVFFEKPVAVDPTGVRKVIAAGEKAKQKKLAVVTGTQRRHQPNYNETIKRIHDGQMGDVVACRAYWNGGGVWTRDRKPGMDDVTYQIHNWYYFDWLCGDHIVEQHVHNLDVINWVMKGHPVKAVAVGGRQVRTDPEKHGHIYDHFAVDFEYANGVHLFSMCRHWPGPGNVSEAIVGTKGKSDAHTYIDGANPWRFKEEMRVDGYVQEHTDLIASIRSGNPLNESLQIAESTLTAIMGREAAYTGKEIKWDEFIKSPMDLMPKDLKPGPLPVRPVPMPGRNS